MLKLYGFRAILTWKDLKLTYLELSLDFLEIQKITEILEIRAQICLHVSRMMQGVIGATPPGGLRGAEAPPSNGVKLARFG